MLISIVKVNKYLIFSFILGLILAFVALFFSFQTQAATYDFGVDSVLDSGDSKTSYFR